MQLLKKNAERSHDLSVAGSKEDIEVVRLTQKMKENRQLQESITHAEEALRYQSEMQQLLIDISSKYINLPLDLIDQTIQTSLEKLGLFIGADRVQIHNYDFSNNQFSSTYEWCREGVTPAMEESHKVPLGSVAEMVQHHMEGKHLFIGDVSKMKEGIPKDFLTSTGVKSVLTVPMLLTNDCVGFVGFDSVRNSRSYTEYEITMMKLFANMSVNITSRAKNQERLHRLLETTSVQNKRLKDFSHLTSHNVRASVANLMAINELIHEDPENKAYLNSLDVTVNRLNTSVYNINNLLNFENNHEILEKVECNVTASIKRVLKHSEGVINKKNLEVVVKLPKVLSVKAFPSYLDSIFHNLISNAVNYGCSAEARRIEITHKACERGTSISVRDFGRGIDLERHGSKIFNAGARFHTDNGDNQGLGLFMSKYMVEALGGKIKVASEPGKGTTFEVQFT